jgi:hypothetical protein
MIQQVEIKRYNQAGQWLYNYQDEVIVKDSPEYTDLKTQLKAEQWTLSLPSGQKLDERTMPRLFETKSLTRKR